MALLKNKKAMWVKLGQPEKKYGVDDTQWSIILVVDGDFSSKWVKNNLAMKEKFLTIDDKETPVIKLKRDTHWKKSGEDKTPVRVVDMFGQDIDARTIGNGSVVNVQYTVRDWEFQGRKGRSPELVAVQVVELVEYTGSSKAGNTNEFDFLAREEVVLDTEVPSDDLDLGSDDIFE